MNSFVSDVLNKSSMVGKAESSLELFWAIVIGVILIIIGFNINTPSKFQKTVAKIINGDCNLNINNKNNYICTMNVEYFINNKKYISVLNTNSNKDFTKFKNIEIFYNTINPREIYFQDVDYSIMTSISFIIASFIILSASVNFYINITNDTYASIYGANTIYNKLSLLFKK